MSPIVLPPETVTCGLVEAACTCGLRIDHDEAHECTECFGSWTFTGDGHFRIVRLPDIRRALASIFAVGNDVDQPISDKGEVR